MNENRIFRDELPGERKSIINLLMTGFLVAITCMGYIAFYLYIQLGQMDRVTAVMNAEKMNSEQLDLIKSKILKATRQIRSEVLWLVIIGSVVSLIGGIYTFNLVIRPLRQLVQHTEDGGKTDPPEIKTNNEIKQLSKAISHLLGKEKAAQPSQEE